MVFRYLLGTKIHAPSRTLGLLRRLASGGEKSNDINVKTRDYQVNVEIKVEFLTILLKYYCLLSLPETPCHSARPITNV